MFAKNLVALFGSKQAEILANAALYLRVASPFYAVLGILYNMRNGREAEAIDFELHGACRKDPVFCLHHTGAWLLGRDHL